MRECGRRTQILEEAARVEREPMRPSHAWGKTEAAPHSWCSHWPVCTSFTEHEAKKRRKS